MNKENLELLNDVLDMDRTIGEINHLHNHNQPVWSILRGVKTLREGYE